MATFDYNQSDPTYFNPTPAEKSAAEKLVGELLATVESLQKRIDELERHNSGGVGSAYFNGQLLITHPKFPPHFWNGYRLEPLGVPVTR